MGVAAGETDQPEKSIPRAVRNVVFRVLIFYVLAIIVLSAIVPWQQAGLMESPFVQVFDMVGIPFAADLMNFVILTAILSVGNSGLYASTRILWAMSRTGMAPRSLGKVSKRGVPLNALSVTLCFALLSLLTSFIAADTLFMILTAISGLAGTVTWIVIALAQYRFRREHYKAGGTLQDLKYAAPLFPLIPVACILLCCSLFVFLAMDPTQRPSLYWGFGFIALCYGIYYALQLKRQRRPEVAPAV
ncbi:Amino-acid permease RocE [compost metagenome]